MTVGVSKFLSALLLALGLASSQIVFAQTSTRILVGPRAGAPEAALQAAITAHGGKEIGRIRALDVRIVELPATANAEAVAKAMGKQAAIKFAEVDARIAPNFAVNDPSVGSEWHISKMGAPSAWDVSTGNGVVIAILDTGVDGTHPDLAAHMVAGWNMYDNNSNTADVYGHGTAVAGTAAAVGNNSTGVAGLAWNASIMPVRISDTTGYAYFSTIANGLTWAADHGAKVANISYGVSGSSTVQSAAQYLKNVGGVTVVSAGNSGAYDATLASDTMISVAATDSNDVVASWSTWGDFVDLSAPGVSILTTNNGGGYGYWSGTSFSSPATAGTVALMMAANPTLAPATLESLLEQTAVDLGTAGWDQHYGWGRVNSAAAVQAAASAIAVDTQAPTVAISSPSNGATVNGLLTVAANASDNVGVAHVDLYVNGSKLASDATAPYSFAWDSTTVPDGNVSLVAYAYDAAGNYAASSTVTVKVSNTPDTQAPTVTILSPSNGATVGNKVTISASGQDNVGVVSMSVAIDGVTKITVSATSVSYNWNTTKTAKGAHTITVTARDAAGNTSSQSIQVTK